MKILIVVPGFPKLSETFIVNKFLSLLERENDVHVVCQQSEAAEWARFPQLRARPELRHRIHVCWPQRPRWLAFLLMPAASIRCVLRKPIDALRYLWRGWLRVGPDVLRRLYLDSEIILSGADIIHFEYGALAVGRMHLREFLNCKVVASFRGHDLNFIGLEPHYYDEIWAHADGIHCLGKDLWARAQRRGCPPSVLHKLIPPAIDAQFFNVARRDVVVSVGTQERPLRILSVGRLYWTKGYEFALQAVKFLRERGIPLEYRIVGAGNYLEPVAFCVHQLGLKDCVSLLGPMSPVEVRRQMAWADIFLHAAVSEGFCNAVLEAQAMQLPVVCTDADGLTENVLDGVTGFTVARRNPRALAEKLILLAGDPAMRERMGKAGRRRVETQFQLADQVISFEDLYRQVMNQNGLVKDAVSRESQTVANVAQGDGI